VETTWFILIALMLTAYVVLDGFDLGAGIINFVVGRSAEDRRLILKTIGPVWDGNEVWLLASGGALYFAFPMLYASSFSGFYLPLMMVLWLLMLRGIGIELRSHVSDPLWWSFFDFVFSVGSFLLAVFLGAAIGNVIRGVPLDADGYFFEPLWTNFRIGTNPGILDWYTVLTGLLSLFALGLHGAYYVAMKTDGDVALRSRRFASFAWIGVVVLTGASLLATISVRPQILGNFQRHPLGWIIPVMVCVALIAMRFFQKKARDFEAFLSSTTYLVAMLGGAAFAMYPYLLPATTDPGYSLTVFNSHTGYYSMTVGLVWWLIGIALALGYFVFLYRSFRGKVTLSEKGY
jgi:cytochrome bd ubiquinol oxidase subunit II